MERRLAAILAADVVGYSRLMEADEEATVRKLEECRTIIDGLVADHHGRVFGSAGDSVVAEFSSPVEAVRCAVDIRRDIDTLNAGLEPGQQMRFRIGINLGDVIVEGTDLLGDVVNVAARLQALAEPGEICISRSVLDQTRKQLNLGYQDLGARDVKNIAEPVRAYRVLMDRGAAGRIIPRTATAESATRRLALAAFAVAVIGAAAVLWTKPWEPTPERALVEGMALPLPDKPSLAVLPFDNMSGDPDQDYVADGLTEDIIATLSQISSLFVIARNSTFVYKGKPVNVQQVAEELGVRHVLEGSVQMSGDRVRITAQLVDAQTGSHLWAETYDRTMTDLFALQDEITDHIVLALRVKLTEGEEARVFRRQTDSVAAWNHLSRALEHLYRTNKVDNAIARQWLDRAIEADKAYALAYAFYAWTHWSDAFHGWSESREDSIEQASAFAEKAQALDDELPDVYALKGAIYLVKGEHDAALKAAERAVAYNPNHSTNTAILAMVLHHFGRPREAVNRYKTAMRLSPYYPPWYLEELGFAYLSSGQPGEALVAFEKFLERGPSAAHTAHAHVGRALSFHAMGKDDEARAEITKAVEADPEISTTGFGQLALHKDRAKLESALTVLRTLGLPE